MSVDFDTKKIDALFAGLDRSDQPGAAVGIAIGGQPVYRKAFGLATLEPAIALTPATRMRIGSVTKQFTCLAYLLLCEEGRAGIDDPLERHLPGLDRVTHAVTVRQLMGNISGLRDVCDLRLQLSGNEGLATSSGDLVAWYREIDDVNAPPGTNYIYNNGGFLLLSAVIERIEGGPLEEVLRRRIFEPLGMPDTELRRWDTGAEPHSATPYLGSASSGYEPGRYSLDWAGAGAIVSTLDDMLKWLAHMDAPRIGSAATWALMKTPQDLATGGQTRYGLGLSLSRYRGLETLHHSGGWMGANAYAIKIPCERLDIVVMVNRQDVVSVTLAHQIIDACVTGLERTVGAASGSLTGMFRSRSTDRVVQLFIENGRQMASIDGMELPLGAGGSQALCSIGVFSALDLEILPLGGAVQPMTIELRECGNRDELTLARPPRKDAARSICGRYRNVATHTDVTIDESGGEVSSTGRFGSLDYRLRCLADGIWLAQPRGSLSSAVLSFDDDAAAFRYSNYATRALPFKRCD